MSEPRSLGTARLLVALLPVLMLGCVKAGEAQPNLPPVQPPAEPTNRTACDEIYGTAFRNTEERDWYIQNCSKWPLVAVPQLAPAPPANTQPGGSDRQNCNEIRGTAYRSAAERAWYIANCANNNPSSANAGAASSGPDRTNCSEIRGTSYRSPAERDWYLKNCGNR
jgi:hypothetical protein